MSAVRPVPETAGVGTPRRRKDRQFHLMIDDSRYQWLRRRAYEDGVSIGEVVRRAIDACLEVAAGDGGPGDPA